MGESAAMQGSQPPASTLGSRSVSINSGQTLAAITAAANAEAAAQGRVKRPFNHFVAGATGGALAATLLSPLDILRTRLQSKGSVHLRPDKLLVHIVRTEGFTGLYRGLIPTIFGVGPARALYFGFYNQCKQVAGEKGWGWNGTSLHLSAAIIAGIATNTLMSPWWVIRLRLQLQTTPVESLWIRMRRQIEMAHSRTFGARAGQQSMSVGAPGLELSGAASSSASVSVPAVSNMRTAAAEAAAASHSISRSAVYAVGATASAAASAALGAAGPGRPAAAAAAASSGAPGSQGYKGVVDCALRIYREEGGRAFYRGLTASYLGVFETGLQFAMYGHIKEVLIEKQSEEARSQLWAQRVAGGLAGPPSASEVSRAAFPGSVAFAASAFSKLIASAITYPHEVIRTRMREQRGDTGELKYRGVVQSFRTIAAEEGARGLYGGMSVHLLRTVPNAAILLYVVEMMVGGQV